MSSVYCEEESIHEGKLVVHIAENGHSFELECTGTTPVDAVMRSIESVSRIYFNDQLVLCADMKLEPQNSLSVYKLPSNDREVFIFNKARLQVHSPPPPPEEIEVVEIVDPPLRSSSDNPHPLDDASDPALKALPSYERQFRYHFNMGQVVYSRTQVRFQTIERLLREMKVQERAVEVARSNLEQYYRLINQNYLEFMKRYSQQYRVHSDLLMNFGRDVERLQMISLHPSLQSDTQKCLLDLWKEENLRKLAENRSNSHRQFENKVFQFKQTFGEMKRKVEDLFSSKGLLPVRNLEQRIEEHQRYINEQKSILQSLSKDVNTVKKLVDDCLSSQLSSSLRPHDAVSALGPMYEGHEKNHLPRMQACDSLTSELLELCKDQKNEMNLFVHNYVKKITHVSYTIKDIKLQFPVFKEAMARQDDQFVELRLVRGIGPAYRACLAEVIRRKASMKLYMGMAGQLAERLAMKREAEVRRREEFLKVQSLYVRRDILARMGLFDVPSQCVVNVAPFDTALLDIDISDLDQYAPEYLVGPPMKAERQGSLKGSFSMSNDGSESAESEDFASGTLRDSLNFFEENELVEIAGTSKLEVENAKLKAELASAIALICSLRHEIEYESLDESKLDAAYKNISEKTAEALRLKDEHGKHLESMLRKKQEQCVSYEQRIQELEQKLSDQYSQEQKLLTSKNALDPTTSGAEMDERKAYISGGFENPLPCISPAESMVEVSCISSALDPKFSNRQLSKSREGVDENMLDSSSLLHPHLDTSMQEPQCEQQHVTDEDGKDNMVGQLGQSATRSSVTVTVDKPSNVQPSDAILKSGINDKTNNELVLELEGALADKASRLSDTEAKLKATTEELAVLRRELEVRQKLLDESQMNCAHLENCLHEARQEAQTHLCTAERRASEYAALRATSVKMHGLIERFRSCLSASAGVAGFVESWRNLAQSLSGTGNEDANDATVEFRKCIKVLADRIVLLSAFRQELFEKDKKLESEKEQLRKDLVEKEEMIKTLYKKHQLEKQANKEKISFGRLEVHEIAAFVQNSAGHYEAINRNSRNYYLSAESVALFVDHLPTRPSYIIGQIVHVEHQVVKASPRNQQEHPRRDKHERTTSDMETDQLTVISGSSSNPYGLPVGCEYFVVTVAMLPNPKIHSPPS